MADTVCELSWLVSLFKELHFTLSTVPLLYCDNQSALHVASNPFFMNVQNILRLIVISLWKRCYLVAYKLLIYLLWNNLQICLQKGFPVTSCNTYLAS